MSAQRELEFMLHRWLNARVGTQGEPTSSRALLHSMQLHLAQHAKMLSTLLTEQERGELLMLSASLKMTSDKATVIAKQQFDASGEEAIKFAMLHGQEMAKQHVDWQHVFNLFNLFIIREAESISNMSLGEYQERVASTFGDGGSFTL